MVGHSLWQCWAEGDHANSACSPGRKTQRSAVSPDARLSLSIKPRWLRIPVCSTYVKAVGSPACTTGGFSGSACGLPHRMKVQIAQPELVKCDTTMKAAIACHQGEAITACYSSTPHYTMNSHEDNIIRLLRTALRDVGEMAGGSYMRRIRDLDPPSMTSLNHEGELRPNTFFDICCKVWLSHPLLQTAFA